MPENTLPIQKNMASAVQPRIERTGQEAQSTGTNAGQRASLREAFDGFVGETFFAQLIRAMRHTVDKPAYFHGGRAEEVFQSQLDQLLAEKMTAASAEQLTGPMFELFNLSRS